MKRREFLNSMNQLLLLSLAGKIGGLSLLPRIANAAVLEGPRKRFFVTVIIEGGWDVTLGLDPKEHKNGSDQNDMYLEYRSDEILNVNGLRLAPACQALLPYASDIAVINGVFMSDNNVSHGSNLDYISTGDVLNQSPDLSVEIGNSRSSDPFYVIYSENIYGGNRRFIPMSVENLNSFKESLDTSLMSFAIRGQGVFANAQREMIKDAPLRTKMLEMMNFLSEDIQGSGLSFPRNGRDAALTAAAFSSGLSQQAKLNLKVGELDTHSNHPQRHLLAQTGAWDAVANLFRIFKKTPFENGSSLFDHTTFMVISEFARTPSLDASKGKDHNPFTNSVLLAGAGIKGQQSFGTSQLILRKNSSNGQSRLVARPVDFKTGSAPATKTEAKNSNFQFIFPENVISTVLEIMNLDRNKFGSIPLNTPYLPTLIRT